MIVNRREMGLWQFIAFIVLVAVLSSGVAATYTIHVMERECQAAAQ